MEEISAGLSLCMRSEAKDVPNDCKIEGAKKLREVECKATCQYVAGLNFNFRTILVVDKDSRIVARKVEVCDSNNSIIATLAPIVEDFFMLNRENSAYVTYNPTTRWSVSRAPSSSQL